MIYILLAISMAACLSSGIITKFLLLRAGKGIGVYYTYNAITSGTAGMFLLILSSIDTVSVFTVVLGIVFGLVTALQQLMNLKALEIGPLSYTTVLMSLSTLIPTLSGALFWKETIHPVQIVGIVLMMGCFLLSISFQRGEKKASLRWFAYSMIAFLCTGCIGVMQKWHQNSEYKQELDLFLVIAFAVSTLFSASMALITVKRQGSGLISKVICNWVPVVLLLSGGICVALNNKLNLYLSGLMDSAVFYPTVNGGNLILTALAACILFRERPRKLQWLGIALGTVAVILLCNPFG